MTQALKTTNFQVKLNRLEPLAPLALGVHGSVILAFYGGELWQWISVGLVALFGLFRLFGPKNHDRFVYLHSILILVLAWALMATTGASGSFFLLWYFVLVSVYPLFLKPLHAKIIATVAPTAALLLLFVPPYPTQVVVVIAGAFLLAFIGWWVQAMSATLIESTNEARQAEEAWRQSEKRFEELLESAPDAIIVVNQKGEIILTNTKAEQMFGYQADELQGQSVEILIPENIRDKHIQHRHNFFAAPRSRPMGSGLDLNGQHSDGSLFPVEISLSPLETSEGLLVTSIIRNITRRKQLEEQYRQAQKMEAIGQLTGGITHDFNNLLTAIIGFAQLLQMRLPPNDPLQGTVKQILDPGLRAADLIRQLLAFSRKQAIEPKVLNLNDIVADMEKMLERIIDRDIEITTNLATNLGLVKIDPNQLEQVIINLAVNARDAMPHGGRLVIETGNVYLDDKFVASHVGAQKGKHIRLKVRDTGTGIPKEIRNHIFDPFFTTKEKGEGTGLGLSTVYGIIKQNDGNIWIQSEIGQGTTFEIYFPETIAIVQPTSHPVQIVNLPVGTETILLVEDSASVRKLVCDALQNQGYTMLEAQDGQEALRLSVHYTDPLDLLLTDVMMPGMNGDILAERLKQIHPETKTLFMSGLFDKVLIQQDILKINAAFLQKPFNPDILINKVRQVLDTH